MSVYKRAVVNVAVPSSSKYWWLPHGQKRLVNSLSKHYKEPITFMAWNMAYPQHCPPHEVMPYAFKYYSFMSAFEAGFETVLWLDASCWFINSANPLFEEIERKGYLFSKEGWYAGQWTKDEALETMKLTRDEAMNIPMLGGQIMGLCLRHQVARDFFHWYEHYCRDGTTLLGLKDNLYNCHSKDPRCLGHTHDQSIASIIAHRLGMELTVPPKWRGWEPNITSETVITSGGMNERSVIEYQRQVESCTKS